MTLGTPRQWITGGFGALVGFWVGDVVSRLLPDGPMWPRVAEIGGSIVGMGVGIALSPATPTALPAGPASAKTTATGVTRTVTFKGRPVQ